MPIDPSSIALFTSCFFPDPSDPVQQVRAKLAMQSLQAARDLGFSIMVVDGRSDSDLFPIADLGVPVVSSTSNDMVVKRQLAADLALDRYPSATHFVWTEPEKDITPFAATWVERGISEDAAVILPMRLHMESYPLFQQLSERKGNEDIAACFEREMGDHYFGPRVFRKDALKKHWLRDYREYETRALQWASIMSPLFGALAAGERVIGLPVDYTYPVEQLVVETEHPLDEKRLQQRQVITQCALDIHDYLPWDPDWQLTLLDGFTLESQTMDVLDLRAPEPLNILSSY